MSLSVKQEVWSLPSQEFVRPGGNPFEHCLALLNAQEKLGHAGYEYHQVIIIRTVSRGWYCDQGNLTDKGQT